MVLLEFFIAEVIILSLKVAKLARYLYCEFFLGVKLTLEDWMGSFEGISVIFLRKALMCILKHIYNDYSKHTIV